MTTNLGKMITLALGGLCLLLLLVGGLQVAGVGGGISALDAAATTEDLTADTGNAPGLELVALAEEDSYRLVGQRALFNDDRRPYIGDEEELPPGVGPDGEPLDAPPVDLTAVVAGIIITPEHRIAMVRDEKTRKTMKVREGMPLEGELGSWSVREIAPRKVSFDGQDGSEAELELLVHTQALPGGARKAARTSNTRRNRARNEETKAENDNNNESRAEEIRRKVAERRAQMRADAARRRQQQAEDDDDN